MLLHQTTMYGFVGQLLAMENYVTLGVQAKGYMRVLARIMVFSIGTDYRDFADKIIDWKGISP